MLADNAVKDCKWHVRYTNSGWFYPAKIRANVLWKFSKQSSDIRFRHWA